MEEEKQSIMTPYRFERDHAMFELALKLCADRRLAIDVGAHQGMWTAWMASHFNRVVAIEPHEGHAGVLEDSAEQLVASLDTDIELLPCAVGVGEFNGTLASHGDNDGQWHVEPDETGPVRAYSLDQLAQTYGWYEPALVKMDVEGMEFEALMGGQLLLETYRPVLVVELEPPLLARYGASVEDVATLLGRIGYAHVHTSHHDALFVAN